MRLSRKIAEERVMMSRMGGVSPGEERFREQPVRPGDVGMRVVLQRVNRASVEVDGTCTGRIERGWLVLLGVAQGDEDEDAAWVADKVLNLRGFEDENGKMNRSVLEIRGGILLVSQFTLLGDCRGGRRPSFTAAADPAVAERLYLACTELLARSGLQVATGVFRAMMKVELVNDGPVTLLLDSHKQF
jgi:D-tyrosyl-tRNA(Tyr) deacylase